MRELFVETQAVVGEDGGAHCFHYYVTIGEMEVGDRFACESYGIKIVEDGGDMVAIPNITISISRIDGLMELLTRNTVGPAGARDVVNDWL